MKYIVILTLFALVAFFIYWRMRPYIRGVRRFLGVVREIRNMNAAARASNIPRETQKRQPASGGRLARCAACGTWLPASQAVTLRATGATFCSHACLERSADTPRRAHKSAS